MGYLSVLVILMAHLLSTKASSERPSRCPAENTASVMDSMLLEVECDNDSAVVTVSNKPLFTSSSSYRGIYLVYQCFDAEKNLTLPACEFFESSFSPFNRTVTVPDLALRQEGDYCIFKGCIEVGNAFMSEKHNFKEQRNCTVTTSNSAVTTSIAAPLSLTSSALNTAQSTNSEYTMLFPTIGISSTASLFIIGSPLSSAISPTTALLTAQPIEPYSVAIIAVISTLAFSLCIILVFVLIWRRITRHRKQSQFISQLKNGYDNEKKFVYSTNFSQSLITLTENLEYCTEAAALRFSLSVLTNANEITVVNEVVPDKPLPQVTKDQFRHSLDDSKESTSDYLKFNEVAAKTPINVSTKSRI